MNYIGNCTEDEAWETIFSDASDMACVIEDSVNLRLEKFIKIANPNIDMTTWRAWRPGLLRFGEKRA